VRPSFARTRTHASAALHPLGCAVGDEAWSRGVAGLIGVSVAGVVAGTLDGDAFAANSESVRAFHQVVLISAVLVAAGGIAGAIGITNPRRTVEAKRCPGGQLVGTPHPAVDMAPVRRNGAARVTVAT
jgi:hypothetical protein